jgi:methionyl-tRNA formyltransferase
VTKPPRTIFFGSGAFALPALEVLAADPQVELRAVVSTPARPEGRSRRPGSTPVAARAMALGLPLERPERLRDPAAVAAVQALAPELIVLADYGQLVPPAILELPGHGALNLHPSLLPRHRGAAPIQGAILAGDAETGVTLMRMDAGLDSGPLVAQARTPIGANETAPELEARLAQLAAALLRERLGPWLRAEIPTRPQPAEGATMTRPLRRDDGRLDPARPAALLARQVRALQPWPGTFTETQAGRLVLWAVEVVPAADLPQAAAPGTLLAMGDGLALVAGEDGLRLLEVQPGGGRRMTGAELRRGRPALVGSRIAGAPLR